MPIRAALLLLALVSTAEAAPFDDLKADLAACLRFELDGIGRRSVPANAGARYAMGKCAGEIDRLERADPRRLRSDRGLSPSTRAVFDDAFGGRGRSSGIPN